MAEVYSAPKVTEALKLMPSLELVSGFALDFSGQTWDFTGGLAR